MPFIVYPFFSKLVEISEIKGFIGNAWLIIVDLSDS
jgi:hypothetical protein